MTTDDLRYLNTLIDSLKDDRDDLSALIERFKLKRDSRLVHELFSCRMSLNNVIAAAERIKQ